MKLIDALPSLYARPLPVIEEGTSILAAGSLLDVPRRDMMLVVRAQNDGVQPVLTGQKHLAFGGYSILSTLTRTPPEERYRFLFKPIEKASLRFGPVPAGGEMATLLDEFTKTRFGWAVVEEPGKRGFATLADLVSLYGSGLFDTDLTVGDVASPVFSLPRKTKLSRAIPEMIKHWNRRVFLSGERRFVSDREMLTHLFSPAWLDVVRRAPGMMLEATLEDTGAVEPIDADGEMSLRDASRLFSSASGESCLLCEEGVVTPWDLVMGAWKKGRLVIEESRRPRVVARAERSGAGAAV